ncbi:MAG: TIM barrel protein [Verrucomicrobiota bacterium JB024]|nr:TIM barrel protein [Verrucomicrobiota bacterium JB024]
MRLAGPDITPGESPAEWIADARNKKYAATKWPFPPATTPDEAARQKAYVEAAAKANLVIAEVGAWSNPIDPDTAKAEQAIRHCQESLALADEVGAKCCVNVSGSRNPDKWAGPHPTNFDPEVFDMIVEIVRKIIDAVNPKRTFYCLETMPWIFPSSPEEYLTLFKAIDRPGFAVHLDPVNMINCPERAYRNGEFLRECFRQLGAHIKSCHAKDIKLQENLTLHLDECRPGTGTLDYGIYLQELSRLHPDTPLLLEHLPKEEYPLGVAHILEVAQAHNLNFIQL